ncbi:hypothetical protein LVJ94_05500 [Pendulispora rubella]|uniref:Uncharacterized protein n=1 Tax=Pendulispora rubella TaxID=2741070 RepID=A0ABZ2LD64_9BACT
MAREDQPSWPTLDDVTKVVQSFLDPMLTARLDTAREPKTWHWRLR